MAPDGLFAGDRAADLVEHRVHGADVHDVAGERERGELDAVAGAEWALDGDEDPGGESADGRLERPAQEHAAEHAERRPELAQDAEAVGDGADGRDAGHEPVDARKHLPLDGRTLLAGEEELGGEGEEGAASEDQRHDADEVERVHAAGHWAEAGRPSAADDAADGHGEVGCREDNRFAYRLDHVRYSTTLPDRAQPAPGRACASAYPPLPGRLPRFVIGGRQSLAAAGAKDCAPPAHHPHLPADPIPGVWRARIERGCTEGGEYMPP